MTEELWLSFAVLWVTLLSALIVIVSYDLYVYLRYGRERTISRAMWLQGQARPWLKWVWVVGGCGLVIGLALHFWWA